MAANFDPKKITIIVFIWCISSVFGEDCPKGYGEAIAYDDKFDIEGDTMVSIGANDKFVLTPVSKDGMIKAEVHCVCGSGLGFYCEERDHASVKCCTKKEWPSSLKEGEKWTAYDSGSSFASFWADSKEEQQPDASHAPVWLRSTTGSLITYKTITFAKKPPDDSKTTYQYGSTTIPHIETLVRCATKGGPRHECDFHYKEGFIWMAYGNIKTGQLIFKMVSSADGKLSCKQFDLSGELGDIEHNHCYVAPHEADIEPYFAKWHLRGSCAYCGSFSYSLSVGTESSKSLSESRSAEEHASFMPSAFGVYLFEMGVSRSESITTSTSFAKSSSSSFNFQCPGAAEGEEFVYQREVNVYQRSKKGKYYHLQSRFPFAKCHKNKEEPPICGAGRCANEKCQTCKGEATMNAPKVEFRQTSRLLRYI